MLYFAITKIVILGAGEMVQLARTLVALAENQVCFPEPTCSCGAQTYMQVDTHTYKINTLFFLKFPRLKQPFWYYIRRKPMHEVRSILERLERAMVAEKKL